MIGVDMLENFMSSAPIH